MNNRQMPDKPLFDGLWLFTGRDANRIGKRIPLSCTAAANLTVCTDTVEVLFIFVQSAHRNKGNIVLYYFPQFFCSQSQEPDLK